MPDKPAVKGKKKGPFGLDPVLFWGGLGVLGLGVAYFIYKRNAAKQSAGQQTHPSGGPGREVIATGATGMTGAQLFTWIRDHQGHPHVKPWPVDRDHDRDRPPRSHPPHEEPPPRSHPPTPPRRMA